jgi:3-isopropylmalate dehydratase large subunit
MGLLIAAAISSSGGKVELFMHAVHKMLAAAAGKDEVCPGEVITAKVDVVGINDVYPIVIKSFCEMSGTKVWDPNKVYVFLDHNTPASDLNVAEAQKAFREFAQEQGCHLVEINEGIGHILLPERGLIRPGSIVVITDSHTPIHGAYGAFAAGLGATDIAAVLIDGSTWFRVPEVIQVRLSGRLRENVMAKDAALHVLGRLGTEFGTYKIIEFSGPVVEALSMEERMVLTVMGTEMGAKSTFIKPDQTTIDDLRRRTDAPFTLYETDPGYPYAAEHEFDLTDLKPQVAMPHSVDNARNVEDVEGIPIDQVFVGSCTGGKSYDIEVVAKTLAGKKVAPTTRLVVTMATRYVVKESIDKGYYQVLLDAGACITSPGCGGCSGLLGGVIAAHERCVTTANRNFPGRMGGSVEAEIYLTSPLTAAATALTGKLTCPKGL